ncbi:MAG: hypothetical protein GWN00_12030, partial [Aliifodinibius sp.]|nr:hypothetical protein [candidate division Zixibacteria bacterium]NIT56926.1 hypothetical protein [Fodinibius sp.]NIY25509.1 hypothetical protein [Fodinibius sp.]
MENNTAVNAYNATYILWVDPSYESVHNVFRNNTSNGNRQVGFSIYHDDGTGGTGYG